MGKRRRWIASVQILSAQLARPLSLDSLIPCPSKPLCCCFPWSCFYTNTFGVVQYGRISIGYCHYHSFVNSGCSKHLRNSVSIFPHTVLCFFLKQNKTKHMRGPVQFAAPQNNQTQNHFGAWTDYRFTSIHMFI